MPCKYIDVERLRICEPVDEIMARDADELQHYFDDIDSMLITVCGDQRLKIDAVPVDEITGFVKSEALHRAITAYGIYSICRGYNRAANGSGDNKYSCYADWDVIFDTRMGGVTKETILSGAVDDDIPIETDRIASTSCTVF